mmetsp:Transcript_3677/g.8790  ORF Transcript_3677/g.8790 Transcript_3677/m.8790 type:complete len:207 (-) Transcript_3677:44-664(-)
MLFCIFCALLIQAPIRRETYASELPRRYFVIRPMISDRIASGTAALDVGSSSETSDSTLRSSRHLLRIASRMYSFISSSHPASLSRFLSSSLRRSLSSLSLTFLMAPSLICFSIAPCFFSPPPALLPATLSLLSSFSIPFSCSFLPIFPLPQPSAVSPSQVSPSPKIALPLSQKRGGYTRQSLPPGTKAANPIAPFAQERRPTTPP